MSRPQSDVHVGIVTALPVECAAVRLLVDDVAEQPATGDPNRYVAGWLPSRDQGRPHRVIVALQTQDGTRNAAAICTDLTRSFPNVRCVVMCGVAGGVPAPAAPDRHVRLGDIVVASRGVIDYDHTRTVNGKDHLRRSVEGLSRVLLRADRELEVKELGGNWPWRVWLSDADRPPPPHFARPPDHTDVLFRAGARLSHPRRDRSGHAAGWPRVHRCAIASADRLVRDSFKRDDIAERYNVRAVEMEASGIAVAADLHATHWFVVRGIADYCDDAGKNDLWHGYAARAAAAYLRALLAECSSFATHSGPSTPSSRTDREGSRRGDLAEVVNALLDIPQMQDDYQRRAIMSLLPDHIRTMIADNVNGRLHILAMVQTCIDAEDGRESLLDALQLSLPVQSPHLQRATSVLHAHWPSRRGTNLDADSR